MTRTHVFACRSACRRDVSSCRQYSSSSHENFKRFKIVVHNSKTCRGGVAQTRTCVVHMSSLVAASRHVNSCSTCYELSCEFARQEHDLCPTCSEIARLLFNICTSLYVFCSTCPRYCCELWRSYKRGCSFVFQDKYSGSLKPLHISTRHGCKEKDFGKEEGGCGTTPFTNTTTGGPVRARAGRARARAGASSHI